MTFAQAFTTISTPLLYPFSFFIVTLIGTMLGSLVVTQGNGWGKIMGSNKFQSKKKVMIFYIIWAIGISWTVNYFSPQLENDFIKYVAYFPAIILQFAIIFYLWFNRDFHYKQNWLKFGLVELAVVILGYLVVSGI